MDITPPWTSDDTANLRAFLDTRTGSRLIPKLGETAPVLFESGDAHMLHVRSGKLLGFQAALKELFFLAYPPPEVKESKAEGYPPLTDDEQWNDGQKLATPS